MTWYTKILLFLLSHCPDVNVAVTYPESDDSDDMDAVEYLEWCYDLDSAFYLNRSVHGEDPPRSGFYDQR